MEFSDVMVRNRTPFPGRGIRKSAVALAAATLLISGVATAQADTTAANPGRGAVGMLSTLPGGNLSWAYGINESNVITGFAEDKDGHARAARWDSDGKITNLGVIPGFAESTGFTINNEGTVSGRVYNGHVVEETATTWDAKGKVTALPGLPGGKVNRGYALNDAGVVVGISSTPEGTFRAVRWDDGKISELSRLPEAEQQLSGASWINEKGQISGFSGSKAVFWDAEGVIHPLTPMPSPQGPIAASRAYAINESGTVVGAAIDRGAASHAVRWSSDGQVVKLQPLPGDVSGAAYGINNDGWANGYSMSTSGVKRAVVWDAEGNVFELNPGGPRPSEGYMINDLGVVVGQTSDRNWATRGLTYTPAK